MPAVADRLDGGAGTEVDTDVGDSSVLAVLAALPALPLDPPQPARTARDPTSRSPRNETKIRRCMYISTYFVDERSALEIPGETIIGESSGIARCRKTPT